MIGAVIKSLITIQVDDGNIPMEKYSAEITPIPNVLFSYAAIYKASLLPWKKLKLWK